LVNAVRDNDIGADDFKDEGIFATKGWKIAKGTNDAYSFLDMLNARKSYKSFSFIKNYRCLGKDIQKTYKFIYDAKKRYASVEWYLKSLKYQAQLGHEYRRKR